MNYKNRPSKVRENRSVKAHLTHPSCSEHHCYRNTHLSQASGKKNISACYPASLAQVLGPCFHPCKPAGRGTDCMPHTCTHISRATKETSPLKAPLSEPQGLGVISSTSGESDTTRLQGTETFLPAPTPKATSPCTLQLTQCQQAQHTPQPTQAQEEQQCPQPFCHTSICFHNL